MIPARGGSKGVPHKNVRELCGKPLLAYTILCAKACRYLDRIVVSTDDPQISEVARRWGAEAPFVRPGELSLDTTPTWPVLKHATAWVESDIGGPVETAVLLQPTSPFRITTDIDNAIELYNDLKAEVVASATRSPYVPHFSMMETEPGSPWALSSRSSHPFREFRQSTPDVWGLNGAIYVVSRKMVFECGSHYEADRYAIYPMPEERSLDIDTEFHFEMAEWLMSRGETSALA